MQNAFLKKHACTILIIGSSLCSLPNTSSATVADGVYAYEKGDYQQALMEWLPYAALGNSNALYNLGQLYRMGRGVEINYAKAKDYYLRAAEKGHIGAQRNLGTLYYFGRLGDADHAQALSWLTMAAISGDARSQLMVGTMYFNGEAGKKDNIRAYAWILLASQNRLTSAANTLKKLITVMTPEEIDQAKKLSVNLISPRMSPDDHGLMVGQQVRTKTAPSDVTAPNAKNIAPPTQQEPTLKETKVKGTEAAVQAATAADKYRVQIASFRTEEAADKAMRIIERKFAPLLKGKDGLNDKYGKIEFADLGEKGIYYRLQIMPFAQRRDAEGVCDHFKKKGQNCYVIKTP